MFRLEMGEARMPLNLANLIFFSQRFVMAIKTRLEVGYPHSSKNYANYLVSTFWAPYFSLYISAYIKLRGERGKSYISNI